MLSNPELSVGLVTFTLEILNAKLLFCGVQKSEAFLGLCPKAVTGLFLYLRFYKIRTKTLVL